jgi:type II secretory pathway pseudopilin PulG
VRGDFATPSLPYPQLRAPFAGNPDFLQRFLLRIRFLGWNLEFGMSTDKQNGYALVALMIIVTVMLISITEALPRIARAVQREREEEAIFRGEQYARAIYLFHRTLGRYPNSVKELLNTNATRFLRQAYTDPLSPNGRWHFLHASAAGVILDSQNQTVAPAAGPGAPSSAFGQGTQGIGNTTSGLGASGQPASNNSLFGPPSGMNTPSSGMNTSSGFGFGTSQAGESSSTESSASGKKKGPPAPPADCKGSEGADSSSPAQSGQLLGATIVGVAPCNNHASIRVLNKKDHYYQWEFLGMNYVPYALPKTQTLQPSSSFPNSQPGQAQPFGSPAQPLGSPMNSAPPATQGISPQPDQNP